MAKCGAFLGHLQLWNAVHDLPWKGRRKLGDFCQPHTPWYNITSFEQGFRSRVTNQTTARTSIFLVAIFWRPSRSLSAGMQGKDPTTKGEAHAFRVCSSINSEGKSVISEILGWVLMFISLDHDGDH
jgi:hypothetical protein